MLFEVSTGTSKCQTIKLCGYFQKIIFKGTEFEWKDYLHH